MEFIPSMEIDRRSIAGEQYDDGATPNVERLIQLSSWMMILGTIRVICAFADSLSAFLEASRFESISLHLLGRFVEENPPIILLSAAWPLLLAIALRRARWPQLLPAAGFTFLILSFVGLLELSAEWNHARGDGITFGSFHLTRRAFLRPTVSDVALGLLGISQLLAECATGVQCLMLAHRFRGAPAQPVEPARHEGARRARFGRLAVYASLGFLVVMIRLPVWSTYVELLNESSFVREFVLKNDDKRTNVRARSAYRTNEESALFHLRISLETGLRAASLERFLETKEAYLTIISQADSTTRSSLPPEFTAVVAEAENNLAWLLATCPKTELRDPRAAVEHAERATELDPNQGNFWNTLGVAYYRTGEWEKAQRALERSMELRNNGDSFDWFFLALVHLKQGNPERAREWYAKAVASYQQMQPFNRELRYFHSEAAQEMGLPKPPPLAVPPPVMKRQFR